ncbi:MAG: hypothetical protein ACTSWN_13785 [Promethearchaeota archaeon]
MPEDPNENKQQMDDDSPDAGANRDKSPDDVVESENEDANEPTSEHDESRTEDLRSNDEENKNGAALETGSDVLLDEEEVFDSEEEISEILAAIESTKKEEEKIIEKTIEKIEKGEVSADEQLESLPEHLKQKIQEQLEDVLFEEEKIFVSEEDFIKKNKDAISKIWFHCLYFLAFKSEDGKATKEVLYEALKYDVSKSPIDPLPEHMFNFGLSALVKIYLYDKPIVGFERGVFSLQVNRQKLQELLLKIGRPLSRRPVITKEEEKKMISDFFSDEF